MNAGAGQLDHKAVNDVNAATVPIDHKAWDDDEGQWNAPNPLEGDPLLEDTESGSLDLAALLDRLTSQHEVDLPNKDKDDDDDLEFAVEHIDPNESKIFIPLASSKSDEAKSFRGVEFVWAQLVINHNNKESLFPKQAWKDWSGANIRFSIIDSTLRHAIKMVVVVENKSRNSRLPPDLVAEVWFDFGKLLLNKEQIKDLKHIEILKPDTRPPRQYTLKEIADAEATGTLLPSLDPVDDDVAAIDLKWTTSGAITVHFKFFDPNWTDETKAVVALCENLRNAGKVHIRLPVNPKKKEVSTRSHYQMFASLTHYPQKINSLAALRDLVKESPDGPIPKDGLAPPRFWQYHRKSGNVEVKFNGMLNAETLKKRDPFVPIPVPGELYFTDPREAEVKLGYGAYYDYEYGQEVLKLAAKSDHRMGFLQVGDTNRNLQLVSITLNKDKFPERYMETYQIRADAVDICVKIDAVGDRPIKMHVTIIDNVLDVNLGGADLLGLISGKVLPQETFATIASTYPEPPSKFFTGTLTGLKNDANIMRELDAIHQLCKINRKDRTKLSGDHARWWPILLNQTSRHHKIKIIPDCDEAELLKAQEWANTRLRHKEQKAVINAVNELAGAVGVLSGPPGTGKTLTIVHVGVVYWKMGGAILYITPTQKTADTVIEYLLRLDVKILVVRVYRRSDEEGELRKGQIAESIDMEIQSLEISIILTLRKEGRDKVFGKSEYSLARTMLDRALSGVDEQVMIAYKAKDAKEEEQIDLWAALREYIARLANADTQYHTWTPEDKARYSACCQRANAIVIEEARFVVVTANNAGTKVITQNFGKTAKFIVVLCDEAGMIKESDQWIPIVKLACYKKIVSLWLAGDHKQLYPLIVSLNAGLNPYAAQLLNSTFTRLVLSGHPTYELILSGRMHQILLRYPNMRTYGGKLRATYEANNRPVPQSYRTWFMNHFQQANDDGCRLLALFVEGTCAEMPSKTLHHFLAACS